MTETLWQGSFGREYRDRNRNAGVRRGRFWRSIIHKTQAESVLEVGANLGANLRHLVELVQRVSAIDTNREVIDEAREHFSWHGLDARQASATAVPFADNSHDLVFTCGVLIHLPNSDLPRAMDEIFRVSSRWIMAIEYEDVAEVEVPYRGERGALWRRPFAQIYRNQFPELQIRGSGLLGKLDGFDSVNWYLWEKP